MKKANFAYVTSDRRDEFFEKYSETAFPANIYFDEASGTMFIVEKKSRGIKKLIANIKKLWYNIFRK